TEDYEGLQQALNAKYQYRTYNINYSGSLLQSEADSLDGDFFKQRILLTKNFKKLEVGTEFQQEVNKTYHIDNHLLNLQSFSFRQYDYFIRSTSHMRKTAFQLNYITRFDEMPLVNTLQSFSKASTYNAKLEFNKTGKSPLTIHAAYRTIEYLQENIANQNEETLLSGIDNTLNTFKVFVNLNSFY